MRQKLKVIRKIDDDFTLVGDIHSKEEIEEIESEVASGENIPVSEGKADESVDQVLVRINKSINEYQKQKQKKVYSFRLKVATVEALKKKASALGIPYQTYVGAVLDQVAL